ncbi:hypothetical protein HDU92_005767 [Lobulomyces angularis]|nr:hypothetical protein HDU92_005767 [Lobulomyces angularis]
MEEVDITINHDIFKVYKNIKEDSKSLFIFHHGAGQSALVWFLTAKLLNEQNYSTLFFDCRGHGSSRCENENDISLETLSNDMINVIFQCFTNDNLPPQIVLVGHSLGGAVVVDVAKKKKLKGVIGVAVLDVVEGTAVESLVHMDSFLSSRPSEFVSVERAIHWTLKSMALHNLESAKISVPSQLIKIEKDGKEIYGWRTNLHNSKPHWDGKYQLIVVSESGHNIQEDSPQKVSSSLIEFLIRNQPLNIKKFYIPLNPHNNATSPN